MTSISDPVDPVEQRDAWRAVWQAISSNVLLAAIGLFVAIGAIAMNVLPQTPSAGVADPVAYSRWEANAHLQEGQLYDLLTGLGLNSVQQAVWWRVAVGGLGALAALRLLDHAGQLIGQRHLDPTLIDERRMRVIFDAPPLQDIASRLRALSHRVATPSAAVDAVIADRWPWANALPVVLYLGLLLLSAGIIINLLLGWEVSGRAIFSDAPVLLPSGAKLSLSDVPGMPGAPLAFIMQPGDMRLSLADGQRANIGGATIHVRQVTPGYRVTATTANGSPLPIRASNFLSPTAEVLIVFNADERERYIAVPDASVALAISVSDQPGQPDQARAFALPSGTVITDTVVQPELIINTTRFVFTPARGGVVDAISMPGLPLVWIGLVLAVLGLIGILAFPARRILVRHHGHWTEFYASGRGARKVIGHIIATQTDSK